MFPDHLGFIEIDRVWIQLKKEKRESEFVEMWGKKKEKEISQPLSHVNQGIFELRF